METKVITEAIASLNPDVVKENDIYCIYQYVLKDGKSLKEEMDLKLDDYYKEMRETGTIRKTAHVGPIELKIAFADVFKKSLQVVYLAASSKLTGTYQIAAALVRDYPSADIAVWDTKALLGMQGLMVLEAADMGKEGKKPREIVDFLEREKQNFGVVGALDTLKYVAASGRIGKGKALLGSLFSIKPIVSVEEGELSPVDRARTHQQALEKIIEYVQKKQSETGKKAVKFMLHYTDNRPWLATVQKELEANFSTQKIYISQMAATVGSHLGPGSWGVAYYFV